MRASSTSTPSPGPFGTSAWPFLNTSGCARTSSARYWLVSETPQSSDGTAEWGTVGVNDNIVEASLQALVDSLEYALVRPGVRAPAPVS